MASVADALTEARAAGLQVRAEANWLVVRGPRTCEDLARQLLACKGEVLALLAAEDDDVAWRAAAMRPQVPRQGPIPFLVARDVSPGAGCCLSCGDALGTQQMYRCDPCTRAAWAVLREVREGVQR